MKIGADEVGCDGLETEARRTRALDAAAMAQMGVATGVMAGLRCGSSGQKREHRGAVAHGQQGTGGRRRGQKRPAARPKGDKAEAADGEGRSIRRRGPRATRQRGQSSERRRKKADVAWAKEE